MSEQKTQQKSQTFRGTIENVQTKNTRSGLAMVVFTVNGYAFKAFGGQAEAVHRLDGQHAEITAKHNTFQGKDEYAVVTIAGEVGGQRIAATDTSRSLIASSAPQQAPKHADRPQRNLNAYGSNVQARKVVVWLNQFFDDLTEAEWEQWKERHDLGWPIHDTDRQAERDHNEKTLRQFKEDIERRYGKPYWGTDTDIRCLCPRRTMPQDLESVKARFYTRLDEVRGDLRRKASTTAERPDETQELPAPNESSIRLDSAKNPPGQSYLLAPQNP